MVDNNLAKRILKLRSEIDQHAKAYYELDNPSVSDAVYDGLVRELKDLDKKYPEFADPNFIIYRVGGKALDHFEKKQHSIRMLSLNDAFSTKEIHGWNDRIQKLLTSNAFRYFCELKLDGLAVSLIYVDGTLKEAITRGDGQIGENITQNVKTISSIPLAIKSKLKGTFEVRGEIVMSKKTLTRLNKKYAKLGRPQLANTRNAAAGSVRQLDATITAERSLDFFAWDIAESERKFETHSQKHSFLREIGFATAPYEAVCKTLIEVEKVIADIEKVRDGFDFGTDGVVIQIDEVSLHKTLGVVGKAPRYALAYKYPAEQATTMVTNITTHVGRTGILTPLAHFKPTLVAGSTVSKATLHNIDQIRRLDIRVGDTVVIQKAGDVIPEIVEVLKNLRPGKTNQFQMPKVCPECSRSVEQRSGVTGDVSVGFYCTNSECPAKQTRTIEHFVKTMEIYEVGPKIIERLQEEGLISDAADLFTLNESDLAGLERFGAKSAENIIREIKSKKNPPLDRFITALGIIHVGEQTGHDLALHLKTFDAFWNARADDLDSIENIGPAVVESILKYTNSKTGNHFIKKLFGASVNPAPMIIKNGGIFTNQTFVLTGTLDTMSREEAKKIIQREGGKVASSVSPKTDFVLSGKNPGSKADDAKKFKVRLIDENTFLNMV